MLLYHGYINHIPRPWVISYTTGGITIWYPTGDKNFATILHFLNQKHFLFFFQNDFFSMSYIVRLSEFIQKSEYFFCSSNPMVSINCSLDFFENFKKHITLIDNDHSITFLNISIFVFKISKISINVDFKGE